MHFGLSCFLIPKMPPSFDQVNLHKFKKNKRLKIKNNLIAETFLLRLFLYVNPQFTFPSYLLYFPIPLYTSN